MFFIYRCLSCTNNISKVFRNSVLNAFVTKLRYCRSLTGDKIARLEENTLQTRILKYLHEANENSTELEAGKPITVTNYDREELAAVDNYQLRKLIENIDDPFVSGTKTKFKLYLKNLDHECCERLPILSINEIFSLLDNFMYIIPNIVTRLKFYNQAIQKISFYINLCSKLELIQLCFYVSLVKNTRECQNILKHCFVKLNYDYLNVLTLDDLVVICNSSFKSSTKINHHKILDRVIDNLLNNLFILNDAAVFITLIKSLRFHKYYDENILFTISHTIFFNKTLKYYNFTACTHILALYADALFYDFDLLNLMTEKCIAEIRDMKPLKSRDEHFSKQIRVKDISRFLWSLSYIGYNEFDKKILGSRIVPLIREYISIGEFDRNIEHFVNILLSLWIMEYYPIEILREIISQNTVLLIHRKRKQRYMARLNLLLTCIQLEFRDIFANLNIKCSESMPLNVNTQIKNRPCLPIVYRSVSNLSEKFNIKRVEYDAPIPHLNILGVTGYNENNVPMVYVELVDSLVCVQNKNQTPHGLMNLKIRLLKTFNRKVLIVFEDQIIYGTQEEFEKFLDKKFTRLFSVK